MKVGDVMTRPARTCQPEQSAESVMRTLWEQDLGAVPVVNERGEPIAMITDRDIAVAAYTQGKPLSQIVVSSAMSKVVHTAHISAPVQAAERTMRLHQVRRLPVVDESARLVGVLSLGDLAKAKSSPESAAASATDVAQTLAAITKRRAPTVSEAPGPQSRGQERAAAAASERTPPAAAPPQKPSEIRELAPQPVAGPRTGRGRKRA
jgi:CBS domain-containing protein